MIAIRILTLILLSSLATAQHNSAQKTAQPAAEPELPMISFGGGCCQGSEVAVTKRSTVYDTWQKNRKVIGELSEGEAVRSIGDTICVTRKPDKLTVKTPIPYFGLETGDVVLRYQQEEVNNNDGYDIWANGGWYRDTSWSQAEDGGEILCTEEEAATAKCYSKQLQSNLILVEPGIREWWNPIQKSDGTKGWVLEQANLQYHHHISAAPEPQPAGKAQPFVFAEPKLPVIDNDACPGRGRVVSSYKITQNDPMYSTYRDDRKLIGTLKAGERVTVLRGVNVIREPDQAVMTQGDRRGDVVLGYGFHANGNMDFWAKGVWFQDYYESIVAKGSWCGFADKSQCDIQITKNGISEWWVQVKTSSSSIGWVRADKPAGGQSWNSSNFGDLCNAD